MMKIIILWLACFGWSLYLEGQELNGDIVELAGAYEGGGYRWKGSGTPRRLVFQNHTILEKSPVGTYCSGYTFTVAFEVLEKYQLLDGLTHDEVKQLQMMWYGATEQSAETQCQYALEQLQLGTSIPFEDAGSGDFVQFWRNDGSGHSAIFREWIVDDAGRHLGLNYRSSQKITNGIGNREEYWGENQKQINIDRIYFARIQSKK